MVIEFTQYGIIINITNTVEGFFLPFPPTPVPQLSDLICKNLVLTDLLHIGEKGSVEREHTTLIHVLLSPLLRAIN